MKHAGGLIVFIAAVVVMWWAGLKGLAVLTTVVCGLAGVAFLVVRTRQGMATQEADRDTRQGKAER